MLVTFKCTAYADITMFGDIALRMLQMMGQDPTVPGAILAAQVPAALENLKSAVAADKMSTAPAASPKAHGYDGADEQPISLELRAQPLIELLAAAAKEKSNLMWDKTG